MTADSYTIEERFNFNEGKGISFVASHIEHRLVHNLARREYCELFLREILVHDLFPFKFLVFTDGKFADSFPRESAFI